MDIECDVTLSRRQIIGLVVMLKLHTETLREYVIAKGTEDYSLPRFYGYIHERLLASLTPQEKEIATPEIFFEWFYEDLATLDKMLCSKYGKDKP